MASNEALVDASAFLELEKGLPEQQLDGVEAACQAVSAKPFTNSHVELRIKPESLDRIALAAKSGGMATFGADRESIQKTMEEIQRKQSEIFREHIKIDVISSQDKDDFSFNDPDFLKKFQDGHLKKETAMNEITKKLEVLSGQLAELNVKLGKESAIPSDPDPRPAPQTKKPPRMTLKTVANRIMQEKLKASEKIRATFQDATLMEQLTHHTLPASEPSSPDKLLEAHDPPRLHSSDLPEI